MMKSIVGIRGCMLRSFASLRAIAVALMAVQAIALITASAVEALDHNFSDCF